MSSPTVSVTPAIPAPARRPSSTPLPCRSNSRSTASTDAVHGIDQRLGRHLQPDGHVPDRHRPEHRPGVSCRTACSSRWRRCPAGAVPGRQRCSSRNHGHPADRHAQLTGRSYGLLSMRNYATINLVGCSGTATRGSAASRYSAPATYSMRVWLDPEKLYSFRPGAEGRHPRDPAAEPERRRRPGRHAAGRPDTQFQYCGRHHSRAWRSQSSSAASSSRTRPPRAAAWCMCAMWPASSWARRPMRRTFKLNGKPAAGIAVYQTPRVELAAGRPGNQGHDGADGAPLPRRARYTHPLRHHDLRPGLDRRGLHDAVPGRASWC